MRTGGLSVPGSLFRDRIASSGITIYDRLSTHDPRFLAVADLEGVLREVLVGTSLRYPIRTRAKRAKAAVCKALGYPVPRSFKKTRPRFPSQNLDVYVQKSDNLQIWNEEVAPERRYVLIRLDSNDVVVGVRVLTGETIARFDRTGTLTSKYQAKRKNTLASSALVSPDDTENFRGLLAPQDQVSEEVLATLSPVAAPQRGAVLSIGTVWARLQTLVGCVIADPGIDQERNRGAELHRHVCAALGLHSYRDEGQFPDVPCQGVEVKLQTSPTIDLGLVSPDSEDGVQELGPGLRHCDMRYAVFYAAKPVAGTVSLQGVVVSTGKDFFTTFRRFGGLVQNRKLQIPLPRDLFNKTE